MEKIPDECRCPKLFEMLDKLDMSQKDFAEKIGASTGNVSDWLMGRAAPTRRRWRKIAEVLNVPAEELMGTKKEPAQLVSNLGGICTDGVTKKTNFLIMGSNEYHPNVEDGKSSKQKKAETLILKGADLQILSEASFLEMLAE